MGTIGELVSAGQRFSIDVTQLEVWASITSFPGLYLLVRCPKSAT